jgi:ABC-2 type transport system permease protein
MIAGYVAGGMVRGILIGLIVIATSVIFAVPPVAHLWAILLFLVLSSLVFSLAGLINGIYAKSFDSISIVPTFVLTPLVYLGGVFYSVSALPGWWQTLTFLNPIFYLINGFRFGFLGTSDVSILTSVIVLLTLSAILVGVNLYLIKKGLGLRQ